MPRCQCAGSSCSCALQGGAGITITGTGTADRPYSITATPLYIESTLDATDTSYELGSRGIPLSTRSVFHLTFPGAAGEIILPDGSGSSQLPPFGSEIELRVAGPSGAAYTFGGAVSWVGAVPPVDTTGFYRFTLYSVGSTVFWAGVYLGKIVGP